MQWQQIKVMNGLLKKTHVNRRYHVEQAFTIPVCHLQGLMCPFIINALTAWLFPVMVRKLDGEDLCISTFESSDMF